MIAEEELESWEEMHRNGVGRGVLEEAFPRLLEGYREMKAQLFQKPVEISQHELTVYSLGRALEELNQFDELIAQKDAVIEKMRECLNGVLKTVSEAGCLQEDLEKARQCLKEVKR